MRVDEVSCYCKVKVRLCKDLFLPDVSLVSPRFQGSRSGSRRAPKCLPGQDAAEESHGGGAEDERNHQGQRRVWLRPGAPDHVEHQHLTGGLTAHTMAVENESQPMLSPSGSRIPMEMH